MDKQLKSTSIFQTNQILSMGRQCQQLNVRPSSEASHASITIRCFDIKESELEFAMFMKKFQEWRTTVSISNL